MIMKLAKIVVITEAICILILIGLLMTPKEVFTSRIEIRLVEK